MMRSSPRSFAAARAVCLPALLAAVLFLARAASAQQPAVSDSDLRRENDQLKQRVAQLETQLAEAQRRSQTLQTEVDRLRKLISSGGAGSGGGDKSASPTTPGSPDAGAESFEPAPEEPLASPASMFNKLVNDYEKDMAPLPRESRQDQQRYLAEARKWAAKAIREIKGKVDWTISNVTVTGEPRGEREVSFQVVNPANGKPYGPVVTSKMRGDLAQKLANQPPESQWKISGMANAAPKVVPERDKPGAFDKPQSFIGPYMEFAFELNTLSVAAVGGKAPAKP